MPAESTNKGALLLTDLTEERGSQERLAEEMTQAGLNVDPPRVSRWRSGKLKPNTAHRMWLKDHRGIDWPLWDQDVDLPEQTTHRTESSADLKAVDAPEPQKTGTNGDEG